MPILAPETCLYPADLFDIADAGAEADARWWALYSMARQEKQLMRRLHALGTPFYSPVVAKRTRGASGRVAACRMCRCLPATCSCMARACSVMRP